MSPNPNELADVDEPCFEFLPSLFECANRALADWLDHERAESAAHFEPAQTRASEGFPDAVDGLVARGLEVGDGAAQRWLDLCARLELSRSEAAFVTLLLTAERDPLFARALRRAWGDPNRRNLCLGLLNLLCADHARRVSELVPGARSLLKRCGLVLVDESPACFSERGVRLGEHVAEWLCGEPLSAQGLLGHGLPEPPPRLREQVVEGLRRLGSARPLRGLICGPAGSGRLAVASQLARRTAPEAGIFELRLAQAEGLEAGARSSLVCEARRVAALTGALVVVTGMEELGRARAVALREVEEAFDGLPLDLVWLAGRGAVWDLSVAPEHVLKLAYPSRDQRFELWSAALAASSASPGTASRLAGGFLLSEGQIEKAVREAVAEARRGGTFDEALTQAARRQAATGLGALAVPQTCNVGLDSLILEASARTQLEQLIARRHVSSLASRLLGAE